MYPCKLVDTTLQHLHTSSINSSGFNLTFIILILVLSPKRLLILS
jgi:hypothetical protein